MTLPRPYRVVLFPGALFVAWTVFWQQTILLLAVLLTVIVALPPTRATDWLSRHHVPTLLVLLTALYAAVDPRPLVAGLVRLVPPEGRPRATHIPCRLARSWLGWLEGTAADIILLGARTDAVLTQELWVHPHEDRAAIPALGPRRLP